MNNTDEAARRRALVRSVAIGLAYFAVSLAWILGSDAFVAALVSSPEELSRLQNYKGIAFVALMSVVLGLLFYRFLHSRAEQERAYTLMTYDPVTRLPNLRAFSDQLLQTVTRGNRFALIFIDIREFAGINAGMGREVGDEVLFMLAGRLRRTLDRECFVARLQADKFGIIVPLREGKPDTGALAEGLVSGLGNEMRIAGQSLQLNLTAGISCFPEHGNTMAQLMDASDLALKQTRHPHQPPVVHYQPAMQQIRTEHFRLESELRDAMRRNQLVVYYQPQVALESGTVRGAEALVRWLHPRRGLIPPSRFIPVAEASGLIDRLSEYVLDEVCRQLCHWVDEGLTPVPVGINIAGHQLGDWQLAAFVRTAAERYRVPLRWLEIEVTESMAVRDPERGVELLKSLRELGLTVALDDFGTGYSSLQYLLDLPVDVLKIDRSFISGLPKDTSRVRFIRTIVDLARDLGLRVVAEGVETRGQAEVLRQLGCHFAQGYLFGPPVAADEFRPQLQAASPTRGRREQN